LRLMSVKKGVKKDALAYVINDWDNYAIEEAVLLQEKVRRDCDSHNHWR